MNLDATTSQREGRQRRESFRSKITRWGFNCFPAYFFSGARITYIAHDFKEVQIKIPLTWRTRNYVGTLFGGSLYASVDPIYMIMLIKILGKEYIVWDKSAMIHFKKPGRSVLFARFLLQEDELQEIRRLSSQNHSIDRVYSVELVDKEGVVHASVEKVVYVRRISRSSPE
ncbi:MAG: DUF4442 domain-containing protein [Nitrospirae bacterium]|nr:DUF4442 domain-containing protein [Nitrospirota bacterium]